MSSTTMRAALAGIPPIRRGEIKNVRSYRAALRQLASRPDVAGNTALALYDDAGNVHLQVFSKDASGVRRLAYDRPIGRVPVSQGLRPGTTPFGDAIEPLILGLLGRVTGQSFRPKRPNVGGPDIEALEAMIPRAGSVESHELSRAVGKFAQRAKDLARRWSAQPPSTMTGRGRIHAPLNRARWVEKQANRLLANISNLSRDDIDIALGALYGITGAIGQTPSAVERFRNAARARLGIPSP